MESLKEKRTTRGKGGREQGLTGICEEEQGAASATRTTGGGVCDDDHGEATSAVGRRGVRVGAGRGGGAPRSGRRGVERRPERWRCRDRGDAGGGEEEEEEEELARA